MAKSRRRRGKKRKNTNPEHSPLWGGPRPNSGRWNKKELEALARGASTAAIAAIKGRSVESVEAMRAKVKSAAEPRPPALPISAAAAAPRAGAAWNPAAIERIIEASEKHARQKSRRPENNPFILPTFPPAATPPKKLRMAMDDSLNWAGQQWSSGIMQSVASEGLMFLGYPYLAELAQRPEYRVISETIATEMTRKWIKFTATGDEDKGDKIKELTDFLDHLQVRDRFADLAVQDGFFGRSHLFLDDGKEGSDEAELKTPIGDGRDNLADVKIGKGWLKAIRTVEAVWTYPTTYNAINPLRADWYNPQVWYVMGREIHKTRLLTFIGREVPDLLKPAYSFGGLSLSQMAKPYVDIWLTTRESVAALIHSFSVMVLMTDLQTILQPNNAGGLLARAALFNALRDNQGLMMINKSTEDFKNVSASMAGLHELQAQSQEHMASVARIPLVKFTGISPAGLNASSEGEIRAFYDTIAAYQNKFFRPNLNTLVSIAQVTLWGAADPEIVYDFVPLWELNEKEKADLKKSEAEAGQTYIDSGVIAPAEERQRLVNDPDSPYQGLDPEDVPSLEQEEEEGLEPEGGRPQPLAELGAEPPKPDAGEKEPGGEDRSVVPFPVDPLFAGDEFNEADHPRAPDGKFGGGGSAKPGKSGKTATKSVALDPTGLKRVGNQMGSNPGGVFEDASGKKFYVKQPQSKAHVRNELLAARLYALAGSPTLNYRPVAGGGHVATEMAKLDKDRAHKLSPAEIKEAQKEFMVHAWLGNYDAVGTGGDNLGTVKGVPTALDLGGALAYRAQGAPKGDRFGDKVGEVETMRDPKIAPDASKVFGSMTPEQLKESAEKVTGIRDGAIRAAVKAGGEGEEMADRLIARKHDIAKRFGLATDEAVWRENDHPRAPDGKFGSGGGSEGGAGGGSGKEERQKFRMPQYGLTGPPSHFTSFKDWRREPPPMPKSTGDHADQDSVVAFHAGEKDPPKELNGKKFEAWTPPTDLEGWANVEGQDAKDEPKLPELRPGMTLSSGVIIMEPDGRVWLMRPKGGYGGYDQTFPKGGVEEGLSPQANAIKEAYEETGLKTKILGFVGDYEGDVTVTRFYVGERETGDPATAGEEAEGVILSPPDKLKQFLNRKRDREIAALIGDEAIAADAKFEESKHPRDKGGKFATTAGGGGMSQKIDKFAAEVNEIEADPKLQEDPGAMLDKKLMLAAHLGVPADEGVVLGSFSDEELELIGNKYGSLENAIKENSTTGTITPEELESGAEPDDDEEDDLEQATIAVPGGVKVGGMFISTEELEKNGPPGLLAIAKEGEAAFAAEKDNGGEKSDEPYYKTHAHELQSAAAKLKSAVESGVDPMKQPEKFWNGLTSGEVAAVTSLYGDGAEAQKAYAAAKKNGQIEVKTGSGEEKGTGELNGTNVANLLPDPIFDAVNSYYADIGDAVEKISADIPGAAALTPEQFAKGLTDAVKAGADLPAKFSAFFSDNLGKISGKKQPSETSFGGAEPGKKTAFGGLWKAGGSSDIENFGMNVAHVLSKPANAGQSYRQMLTFMVKKAEETGVGPNKVTALKVKLVEALYKGQAKAVSDGKPGDAKKIGDAIEKIQGIDPDVTAQAFKNLSAEGTGPKYSAPKPPQAEEVKKETKKAAEKAKVDLPAPTAAEKEKAKKNVALQFQYVPGDKPETEPGKNEAQKVIDEFNEKYAGKDLKTDAELAGKVNDFKMLQAKVAAVAKIEQAKKAEWAKEQAEAQKKANAEAAKKAAAQKAKESAALKEIMSALGIANEHDAEAVQGFIELAGESGKKKLIDEFKASEASGGSGKLNSFEKAMVQSYTGSAYGSVNAALRKGSWSVKQHVYVNTVNKALKKMPSYTGETKRHASLDTSVQALYQVGHVVEERAFTSTSKNKDWNWGGNTHYIVKGKSGRDVSSISLHSGEGEVLYPARTFFKVTKVEGKPGQTMTVHMEEVDAL